LRIVMWTINKIKYSMKMLKRKWRQEREK
jgi:hypothetical protein